MCSRFFLIFCEFVGALHQLINFLLHLNFLQDVDVAPEMFIKGKIGLFPHNVKDKEGIKQIFDKTD